MGTRRRATYKMMTFARGIVAGLTQAEALEQSAYATEGWSNASNKATFTNRLMNHPAIQETIARAYDEMLSDAVMTRTEALEQLTTVARAKFTDLLEFKTVTVIDEKGVPQDKALWNFKDRSEAMDLISEVQSTSDGGFKIKMRDPDAALRELAKLQGWYHAPKTPVNQDGDDVPFAAIHITHEVVDPAQ